MLHMPRKLDWYQNGTSTQPPLLADTIDLQSLADLKGTAEQQLLTAIIERALLDALRGSCRQSERRQAINWFFCNDSSGFDTKHHASFRYCAEHVADNPEYFIKSIRQKINNLLSEL